MRKILCIFLLLLSPSAVYAKANASVYSLRFTGHKMANGELYDPYLHTAAHRTLPLGTCLLLVNPANKHETFATVTDRGPWVRGRELDLSTATANDLGFTALALIKYSVATVSQCTSIKEHYHFKSTISRDKRRTNYRTPSHRQPTTPQHDKDPNVKGRAVVLNRDGRAEGVPTKEPVQVRVPSRDPTKAAIAQGDLRRRAQRNGGTSTKRHAPRKGH